MALNEHDVLAIAKLAKLNIEQQNLASYQHDLGDILNLVEDMQSVNTDQVLPLNHPLDATNQLRDDIVTENDHRDDYQTVAPKTEQGLYIVPKVID